MRVFKKLIRLQLTAEELQALTADFISYKRTVFLPDIFSRDALYDDSFTWPFNQILSELAHIYLANVNNPFPPQLRQFSRTNDEAHLVYCQVRLMTSMVAHCHSWKPELLINWLSR